MIASCSSVVLKKHLTFHKSPSFSMAFLGDPTRLHPMSGQKLFQGNHHLGNSRIFRRMWVDDSGNHEISPIKSNIHCNLYVFLVLTYLLWGMRIWVTWYCSYIYKLRYVCAFPINLQMVSKQCVKKYCWWWSDPIYQSNCIKPEKLS